MDGGKLLMGNNIYASSNLNIQCAESVVLGDNLTLGWDVTIMDTDYHKFWDDYKNKISNSVKPVYVGDNCWIGLKTIITKGTILKEHTIIGAGSVVSGIFHESHIIIKGNPATIYRKGVSIKEDLFW